MPEDSASPDPIAGELVVERPVAVEPVAEAEHSHSRGRYFDPDEIGVTTSDGDW